MSNSVEYREGIDCVWLAVDRLGNVGAFVTGGEGPIPGSAVAGVDLLPPLEEDLVSLLKIAGARQVVEYKNPSTFVAMAERGIYTFDWRDVHRTNSESTGRYELVCAPSMPLKAEALPRELQTIAMATCMASLEFGESENSGVAVGSNRLTPPSSGRL
jgi:hypothetical protein